MTTTTATIAGKPVTLAYCYATEIAFKELSDQDINDFMPTVGESLSANRMPDIKTTIFLILASITAYYSAKEQEPPIKYSDLMTDATPEELGNALGSVLTLRGQFYHIPAGEQTDQQKEDSSKN